MVEPRFLSTPDAARYIGQSESQLEHLRLAAEGPAFIRVGRRVVYDRTDLDAFMVARRVETSAA